MPASWRGSGCRRAPAPRRRGTTTGSRDGPWKLVIDRHDGTPGPPLLFNLDDDLGEQENLGAAHPERVDRLLAALEAWRADVGAIR